MGLDGAAFDLGVCSTQLDQPERGFSFRADGPLDMRMSKSGQSAADIVMQTDEADLARILWEYGEEKASAPHRQGHLPCPRRNRHSPAPCQLAGYYP
jgi:16S rRNA C1402 N4-methylase RsmH